MALSRIQRVSSPSFISRIDHITTMVTVFGYGNSVHITLSAQHATAFDALFNIFVWV